MLLASQCSLALEGGVAVGGPCEILQVIRLSLAVPTQNAGTLQEEYLWES